jgi:hypothetical protein
MSPAVRVDQLADLSEATMSANEEMISVGPSEGSRTADHESDDEEGQQVKKADSFDQQPMPSAFEEPDVSVGHALLTPSNGLRFSGERSGAERVRCNRGLDASIT